jgi:ABC-type glycerol-3-phosphate transport system permease component
VLYVLVTLTALAWLFPVVWAVLNSLIITVPAVLLTLFLASCVAFVVARFGFRFNLILLGLFTAANLLPKQALLIPCTVPTARSRCRSG